MNRVSETAAAQGHQCQFLADSLTRLVSQQDDMKHYRVYSWLGSGSHVVRIKTRQPSNSWVFDVGLPKQLLAQCHQYRPGIVTETWQMFLTNFFVLEASLLMILSAQNHNSTSDLCLVSVMTSLHVTSESMTSHFTERSRTSFTVFEKSHTRNSIKRLPDLSQTSVKFVFFLTEGCQQLCCFVQLSDGPANSDFSQSALSRLSLCLGLRRGTHYRYLHLCD